MTDQMKEQGIELGDLAKDVVTGFTGVVTDATTWLHGCDRIALTPRELTKDGKPIESEVFDALQIEVVQKHVVSGSEGAGCSSSDLELGDLVKDTITGFTGVVIAETTYLHYEGRRLLLQPQELHEGKTRETQSFHENQLVLVRAAAVPSSRRPEPVKKKTKVPGGPRDDAAARSFPGAR